MSVKNCKVIYYKKTIQLQMENFDFIIIGDIIINPKTNLKRAAVITFTSS